MVIIDTAPLTLAIETVGGVMAPIIPRNTAIPVKRSQARSKFLKILNFSGLAAILWKIILNFVCSLGVKNVKIFLDRNKIFSTAADNQNTVTIRIFEGERPMTKDNNLLGNIWKCEKNSGNFE